MPRFLVQFFDLGIELSSWSNSWADACRNESGNDDQNEMMNAEECQRWMSTRTRFCSSLSTSFHLTHSFSLSVFRPTLFFRIGATWIGAVVAATDVVSSPLEIYFHFPFFHIQTATVFLYLVLPGFTEFILPNSRSIHLFR